MMRKALALAKERDALEYELRVHGGRATRSERNLRNREALFLAASREARARRALTP